MIELELSIQEEMPGMAKALQHHLEPFEARHEVKIKLTTFNWENAWQELVKIALYRHGPDVS